MSGYTDIFTKHVFKIKDYTYHILKNFIQGKDTVVMKSDKDLSVVVLNKIVEKVDNMVKECIDN